MKFPRLIVLAICFLLFHQASFAQPICAFDRIHKKLLAEDSSYRKNLEKNEEKIKAYIRKHPESASPTTRGSSINAALYTIPVVVHVIHTGGAVGSIYNPTTTQINGAINYLNQVYNGTYAGTEGVGDIQIQFVLATKDTNCNTFSGIDRIDGSSLTNYVANGVNSSNSTGVPDVTLKNFDRWDPGSYYNIWVVNKIDGKDGTSGQFVAGYAYFAGASPTLDGTVMLATQMVAGQKTLPHEIGHALGLYHPFEGSPDAVTCPANTACSTDGDKICDTDPITYNQTGGVVDFSCRSGINSCTGTAYSINTEHNYMNYTSCYTLFTAGQRARMQAAMSLFSRQSLASSPVAGTIPVYPYTPPLAACTPVTSASGLAGNYAGVLGVQVANRTFSSSTAAGDNGYLNNTTKCFDVIPMQQNNSYNFTIVLLGVNYEQLAVWIDYNNDGVFNNTTELAYYNPSIAPPGGGNNVAVSSSFTVPAAAVAGPVLRMRVMDELSTAYGAGFAITGACYNPSYGQAEDYPVFLSALLPVKLDYFRGVRSNDDAVLSWKTSQEENAQEFQVEKSTDGTTFSVIGTVPATNNATGSVYGFTDKHMTASANYYRLRQIDKDLKAELSNSVLIKTNDNGVVSLKVNSNPFNKQLSFVINGNSAGAATIDLYDATGRQLINKRMTVTSGQIINLDVAGIIPGMYVLRAQVGNSVMTEKVIKQ